MKTEKEEEAEDWMLNRLLRSVKYHCKMILIGGNNKSHLLPCRLIQF